MSVITEPPAPTTFQIMDEEKRLVSGWASVEVLDRQNDIVPTTEMTKALLSLMDRGGTAIFGHSNKPVAKILQWEIATHPITKTLGVHLIMKIFKDYEIDDIIWDKIKKGEIKGFSIGATAKAEKRLIKDASNPTIPREIGVLHNLSLLEVSLVENPANQFALIDNINYFAKSDDVKGETIEGKPQLSDRGADARIVQFSQHTGVGHPTKLGGASTKVMLKSIRSMKREVEAYKGASYVPTVADEVRSILKGRNPAFLSKHHSTEDDEPGKDQPIQVRRLKSINEEVHSILKAKVGTLGPKVETGTDGPKRMKKDASDSKKDHSLFGSTYPAVDFTLEPHSYPLEAVERLKRGLGYNALSGRPARVYIPRSKREKARRAKEREKEKNRPSIARKPTIGFGRKGFSPFKKDIGDAYHYLHEANFEEEKLPSGKIRVPSTWRGGGSHALSRGVTPWDSERDKTFEAVQKVIRRTAGLSAARVKYRMHDEQHRRAQGRKKPSGWKKSLVPWETSVAIALMKARSTLSIGDDLMGVIGHAIQGAKPGGGGGGGQEEGEEEEGLGEGMEAAAVAASLDSVVKSSIQKANEVYGFARTQGPNLGTPALSQPDNQIGVVGTDEGKRHDEMRDQRGDKRLPFLDQKDENPETQDDVEQQTWGQTYTRSMGKAMEILKDTLGGSPMPDQYAGPQLIGQQDGAKTDRTSLSVCPFCSDVCSDLDSHFKEHHPDKILIPAIQNVGKALAMIKNIDGRIHRSPDGSGYFVMTIPTKKKKGKSDDALEGSRTDATKIYPGSAPPNARNLRMRENPITWRSGQKKPLKRKRESFVSDYKIRPVDPEVIESHMRGHAWHKPKAKKAKIRELDRETEMNTHLIQLHGARGREDLPPSGLYHAPIAKSLTDEVRDLLKIKEPRRETTVSETTVNPNLFQYSLPASGRRPELTGKPLKDENARRERQARRTTDIAGRAGAHIPESSRHHMPNFPGPKRELPQGRMERGLVHTGTSHEVEHLPTHQRHLMEEEPVWRPNKVAWPELGEENTKHPSAGVKNPLESIKRLQVLKLLDSPTEGMNSANYTDTLDGQTWPAGSSGIRRLKNSSLDSIMESVMKDCGKKHKRMARHIEESEEESGKSPKRAKEIAYATINARKYHQKAPWEKPAPRPAIEPKTEAPPRTGGPDYSTENLRRPAPAGRVIDEGQHKRVRGDIAMERASDPFTQSRLRHSSGMTRAKVRGGVFNPETHGSPITNKPLKFGHTQRAHQIESELLRAPWRDPRRTPNVAMVDRSPITGAPRITEGDKITYPTSTKPKNPLEGIADKSLEELISRLKSLRIDKR